MQGVVLGGISVELRAYAAVETAAVEREGPGSGAASFEGRGFFAGGGMSLVCRSKASVKWSVRVAEA